jgi:hypothetical protein
MRHLINKITDHIQQVHKVSETSFTVKQIKAIYKYRTAGRGKLWDYALSNIAGAMTWGRIEPGWAEKFQIFCDNHPHVPRQLIELMMARGESIHATEASYRKPVIGDPFNSCEWHVHPAGKTCASDPVEARKSKGSEKNSKGKKSRILKEPKAMRHPREVRVALKAKTKNRQWYRRRATDKTKAARRNPYND